MASTLFMNEHSANEELLHINATKDKFFSIITHDLKTPFNSIVGYSNLLVEKVREGDCKATERYAGIIELSSNRAMDLLMNLMEWSRSQTGRMEFKPEYLEINSIINEIVLLFADIAAQKNISITRNTPVDVSVFADKAMINTVLRNLISNAIKFTTPGGNISISLEEDQSDFNVSISDTGVGISKSNIQNIFSLDNNITTPGTNNETGTGLGLILCKELIDKHKGSIWAESEINKGSIFHFSIPLIHTK